jgi:hypothetical protein
MSLLKPLTFTTQLIVKFVLGLRLVCMAGLCCLFSMSQGWGQTTQGLHWVNDSGSNALTTLNATSNFITSFKGTNDVHVTLLTGSVNSIFQESFAGLANNNNPGYLTNYLGLAANGTGDGTVGHISFLESALGVAMSLRFTFDIPLTPNDRLLLTDVDTGEKYNIQAFSGGQAVDLSGWIYTPYSGEESQLPDATWPTWAVATTNGTLTANTSGGLLEPLSVLTPDRSIDSVVVTRLAQGGGSSAMQFINLTVPNGSPVLHVQPAGNSVVVSWPGTFNNYALFTTTNMAPPATWTAIGIPPSINQTTLVITNSVSAQKRFYRLQLK